LVASRALIEQPAPGTAKSRREIHHFFPDFLSTYLELFVSFFANAIRKNSYS